MNEIDSWLESSDELRAKLLAYSRSPLPTDSGERQLDVSKALELGQDAGDLLADVEKFLLDATAVALYEAMKDEELNSGDRNIIIKSKTSSISRLRDGIRVLYRTIKDRRFALMNLNRSA